MSTESCRLSILSMHRMWASVRLRAHILFCIMTLVAALPTLKMDKSMLAGSGPASLPSLNSTLTATHYHDEITRIDLYITNVGTPKTPGFGLFHFLVDAKESIRNNRGSAPISNNYFHFQTPASPAELRVYPYEGKEITWSSLEDFLWDCRCYILTRPLNSLWPSFEIDIEIDNNVVGHCTLWGSRPSGDSTVQRS